MKNVSFKNPAACRFFLFITALTLLIAPWFTPHLSAVNFDSPLIPYTKTILENGLTVLVKEIHTSPIAAVDIWVGAGAKNETAENYGISHFFEHMLFKGTTKRKTGEISREIQSVGGYLNAATSLDFTHYYVVAPSEYIDLVLDVEADAIINSIFAVEEIQREREVILEERRLKEDDPQRILSRLVYENLFAGTPYANEVLGNPDSLAKIDRDAFLKYHQQYYTPNNMVVSVAGDVETGRVIKKVAELFQNLRPGEIPPPVNFRLPVLNEVKRVRINKEIDQNYLSLAFPVPVDNEKNNRALDVLAAILGEGRGARLYQELREEKRLVNTISAYYLELQNAGIFSVTAQYDKNGDSSVIEDAIRSILKSATVTKPGLEELNRAKALVKSNFAFASESNAGIAGTLGLFELFGDAEEAVEYDREIDGVTPEDVLRVAKKYFNLNGYLLAEVKGKGAK